MSKLAGESESNLRKGKLIPSLKTLTRSSELWSSINTADLVIQIGCFEPLILSHLFNWT